MNIEQVREYIESEGLNGRSREQFYVFRRHYLCWALYRSQELTLGEVGKLFNRDHSTVLHSIRKHEELKTDRLYQKMTESCVQLMAEPLTFTRQRRNIFEDINKATNLEEATKN
jgi:chromosomal replication initiation ATPase DnaA